MKAAPFRIAFTASALLITEAHAQHCAPIAESYLSQISVAHAGPSLKFHLEYAKNGGQPKAAYQAYLLAYLDKNARLVPAPAPDPLINPQFVHILHAGLIKRNQEGKYVLDYEIACNDLARSMIAHAKLAEQDRVSYGGWGEYKDRIRIALFIPFLEDSSYATVPGLPENKHECNYTNERALLWQPLPYAFSIHFGIVQAVELEPGRHHIQINGEKPRPSSP